MRLSEETLQVLKNFSLINPSILFKKGNLIQTISPAGNLFGQITVEEEFPQDFAIYELGKFLAVVNMMSTKTRSAWLSFSDNYVTISEENPYGQESGGGAEVQFNFAAVSTINAAPYTPINMPEADFVFKKSFDKLIKAAATLQVPDIIIEGNGKSVVIKCGSAKNSSGNSFKEVIGSFNEPFRVVLKLESLIMLPYEYDIKVSTKGIINFNAGNLDYWVATSN